MDAADKEKFIRSLCDSVRDRTIESIRHMPESWDGIELRWFLSAAFERQTTPRLDQSLKRRFRDYRNDVATRYRL